MNFKFLISLCFVFSVAVAENELEDSTDTTESTDTTTIASTSTSTTEKTTTAVPLPSHYYYNVTENNVTCIMLDGSFSFTVTYVIGDNKTNQTTVFLPKPSSDVTVLGSCNSTDGSQFIDISWGGSSVGQSNIKIVFNSTQEKTWTIKKFTSTIFLDKDNFVNGTDIGKSLFSDIGFQMAPTELPANHSFKCFSRLTFSNVTTLMENNTYSYPILMTVEGIQLEAYNKVTRDNKFAEEIHCDADKIADIVPIAVGCALAALVTVVLIAYIVGRRRRSAAYQSV